MKAKLLVNKNFPISEIDPRLYGSFVEHLGRSIYGGVYEPTHPTADDCGFRGDVLDLVRELNVPIIRYPGGNFVSGYNWEDGTGDKAKRPRKMELAWRTIETNQVGIDEFQEWVKRANSSVMYTINLGTRGADDARNCIEYCNAETDTYYANLRRKNGFEKPFGIKTWCLGNEMDGNWQIGHKTAEEYARAANEAAKMMKWVDPNCELIACGSSNPGMKTFIDWERIVLEECYKSVDYISMHQYYENPEGNTASFLAKSISMDRFIKTVAAVADTVKAKNNYKKDIYLSFDEWNVWFHSKEQDKLIPDWEIAPPQLEDVYTFEDALVVGCLLMTLQNNSDRVKIACLAQLVNVIAPIMTENGGAAWAQTIFYPFCYGSRYGRGTSLKPVVECGTYDGGKLGDVPYLQTSVIDNPEKRELVVFAVNRSLEEEMELDFTAEHYEGAKLVEHVELYNDDLNAINTKDAQSVAPQKVAVSEKTVLKKHSWNMLRYQY